MKAIYASKMYRSSRHKDKIRAALSNPINAELVQQLKEYLDEDDVIDKDVLENTEDEQENTKESNSSNERIPHKTPSISNNPSSIPSKEPPQTALEKDIDKLSDLENPEESTDSESEDKEETIQNSTSISNTTIESQTVLYSDINSNSSNLNNITDEIKGILNSRQDTCGVNRVLSKESELWIYYGDKINLNNVMDSAIELLNAANYSYLDFNRLARSDNAMVFQINMCNSTSSMKPLGDVQDESKK